MYRQAGSPIQSLSQRRGFWQSHPRRAIQIAPCPLCQQSHDLPNSPEPTFLPKGHTSGPGLAHTGSASAFRGSEGPHQVTALLP